MGTRAGDLNTRLRFDKQVATSDPYGGTVSSWEEQFTRAAGIKVDLSGESVQAQRLTGQLQIIGKVRRDSQTILIDASWRAVRVKDDVPTAYCAIKTVDSQSVSDAVFLKMETGVADA